VGVFTVTENAGERVLWKKLWPKDLSEKGGNLGGGALLRGVSQSWWGRTLVSVGKKRGTLGNNHGLNEKNDARTHRPSQIKQRTGKLRKRQGTAHCLPQKGWLNFY